MEDKQNTTKNNTKTKMINNTDPTKKLGAPEGKVVSAFHKTYIMDKTVKVIYEKNSGLILFFIWHFTLRKITFGTYLVPEK